MPCSRHEVTHPVPSPVKVLELAAPTSPPHTHSSFPAVSGERSQKTLALALASVEPSSPA